MSAPAPSVGTLAGFVVKADGKALETSWLVRSVDVRASVNKVPRARLELYDGTPAEATFPISETKSLIPGAKLEIALGYDGKTTKVFSGVIVRQAIEVSENCDSLLVVEAADQAVAMALTRGSAVYQDITDCDLIGKLIGKAGLGKKVTSTSIKEAAIVQYDCSDWDLMVMRADLNGMLVTAESGKVTVAPPDTGSSPVLTLTYGTDMLDFRAEMDAATQYAASAVQGFAWDPAKSDLAKSGRASASVSEAGNLSSETLAKVFSVSRVPLQTAAALTASELTKWASAALSRHQLAKIRGYVTFLGSAAVKPGAMITLAGVGARFCGNVFVSGVHHRFGDGCWRTTAEFGISPQWFSESAPEIDARPAAGQLPATGGLQIGIVEKLAPDPDGEFRIFVSLPLLQASGKAGVWARLNSPYASGGIGFEFYPEVGDEVLLSFLNNDPRFPVILGSLYSKKRAPPVKPDAKNPCKTIVTKSKLRIDFFEEKKAIEISTPGGQSIRLDDDAKTITLKDASGSKATFAQGGVTIDSAAAITLKAKTNIQIDAGANLALKAKANVTVDGLQISENAKTTFSAKGTAQATLSASGILTIKGAMVQIN